MRGHQLEGDLSELSPWPPTLCVTRQVAGRWGDGASPRMEAEAIFSWGTAFDARIEDALDAPGARRPLPGVYEPPSRKIAERPGRRANGPAP